jgi:hypothetical protein
LISHSFLLPTQFPLPQHKHRYSHCGKISVDSDPSCHLDARLRANCAGRGLGRQ